MKKLFIIVSFMLTLSGCSLFESFSEPMQLSDQTLQNMKPLKVRLMANEDSVISHDEVMEKYRAYLEVSEDAELRVRTHHRIANLRLQKDEFIWEGGDESDEAKLKIAEADFGRESIEDYESLLAQYPDRNDNDLALYQLAKAYSLAGEPFEVIRVLEQLAELYPRSNYYLESLFRLGEVYYANGVYDLAENAYQRLIERGSDGNKYHLSAMYLIGWAQFKQNDYDDSLLSFTQVLDSEFPTEDDILSASISQQDMMKDILRIMAITFDYQGDWENISQFYAGLGGRHYEHLVYDTLAEYH